MTGSGPLVLRGKRVQGLGVGGRYVSMPYYSSWFRRLLGCDPYPGTLNFRGKADWRELAGLCEPLVIPEHVEDDKRYGAVYVWRARLRTRAGKRDVLVIRPLLSAHEPQVLEIVACEKLAPLLPDDEIEVEVQC
ncbi:hypothetical protein PYJP_01690 [Pyrofollis japonicus]|uniref:DUF120 domain-containing protein n=1 Tax=Pyrofollis japonicus TaxID=3060460 RepID=UPI00295B7FDC|nr:DUF120 domain-containing protein [Pyrofollis japonicus]BEP16817.1 hypothetical protein PYJP_01690 [Pyrofollis japonicus]